MTTFESYDDSGADEATPDAGGDVPADSVPDEMAMSSDTEAVLDQVNDITSQAAADYREAAESVGADTDIPTGPEATKDFIDNVMNASPEQLDRMAKVEEGQLAKEEIEASVREDQQEMRDAEAEHHRIQEANKAAIDAEAAEKKAAEAVEASKRARGA